jgi:hypothetical protein
MNNDKRNQYLRSEISDAIKKMSSSELAKFKVYIQSKIKEVEQGSDQN